MQNNRRQFLAATALLGAGAVIGGKADAMGADYADGAKGMIAMNEETGMKDSKKIVHHVFFWLKNPDSVADRDKLVEGVKTLKKIPTVKEIHVGVLAATEKRDVVDTSWQVSELIFFNDLEGQATYQTHPIHLDFVKNYSGLWSKVVVYDMMEV